MTIDEFDNSFIRTADIAEVVIKSVMGEGLVDPEDVTVLNEDVEVVDHAPPAGAGGSSSPLRKLKTGGSGDRKRKCTKVSSGLCSPEARQQMKQQALNKFY
jgi:hypothetical protein